MLYTLRKKPQTTQKMEVTTALSCLFLALILYKLLDFFYRMSSLENLDSHYILITGCDTGFGHTAAKRLVAMGCHVIAGCLTEKGETELKKSCYHGKERLNVIQMDVSNHKQVLQAFDFVRNLLPRNKGM